MSIVKPWPLWFLLLWLSKLHLKIKWLILDQKNPRKSLSFRWWLRRTRISFSIQSFPKFQALKFHKMYRFVFSFSFLFNSVVRTVKLNKACQYIASNIQNISLSLTLTKIKMFFKLIDSNSNSFVTKHGKQRKSVSLWELSVCVWEFCSVTGSRNIYFIQCLYSYWATSTCMFHCRYLLCVTRQTSKKICFILLNDVALQPYSAKWSLQTYCILV